MAASMSVTISCDDEPIHIPGSIQPHGVLLSLHPQTLVIEQVAGDTLRLLGIAADDLLGCSIDQWFDEHWVGQIRDALRAYPQKGHPLPVFGRIVRPGGQPLNCMVSSTQAATILEFESVSIDDHDDTLAALAAMERGVENCEQTVHGMCQAIAESIQLSTGFDRVMVYRFLPDGSGTVEAETCTPGTISYLGLHYPASDIPSQARTLFTSNWLRMIPDISYTPAPLCPVLNPTTSHPLDLSHSVLRSVSPTHLEYLANMGVAASMTISLLRHGALWGLIACHHLSPRLVPMRLRVVCELFASTASLRLDAHVSAAEAASRIVAKQIIESLLLKLAAEPDFATALTRLRPNLFDLIHADGVTLRFGGQTTSVGHTPNDEQILSLAHWLNERDQGVFATDNLVALYPPAEAFAGLGSGLIAVSLSMIPEDYVMWFQPEMIQTVTWAGNPDKAEADAAPAARLTPRTSFAAWRESVRRRSRHWEAAEIEAATSLRMALLEIVLRRIDLLTREQAAARRQQDMLMAELDHRVKNMLATIQALIMQSRGSADTIGGFISTFEGRLYAMSRAHSLLTQGRWEGADLRALIMEEMAPYAGPENSIVVIEGHGTITLRPKAALAFSLGIHELATNAAKYGGLSKPGGRVHIAWHIETKDSKMVVLSWKESGGPPVAEPEKRGFGVTLIENSMAYELGGRVDLQFRSDGVACTIEVPWDQIAHAASPTPRPVTAQTACIGLPAGMRILIVEDNSLIARSTEQLLKAMGANILGPVSRLPIAMQIAESQQMDAALLDIDLDGTRVWPVAEILARRGVPFIFTTGYAAALVMPPAFADRPVLTKPYDPDSLELLLTGIFQKRRRGDIETGQSPI